MAHIFFSIYALDFFHYVNLCFRKARAHKHELKLIAGFQLIKFEKSRNAREQRVEFRNALFGRQLNAPCGYLGFYGLTTGILKFQDISGKIRRFG